MTVPAQPPGELLTRLGIDIDPELLVLSLTHRSFAHEAGGIPTNERLEFLGDSILGVVVTEALYRRHPDLPEGELAKMRAATVSQRALAGVARDLGLGGYVLLGKGELATGGQDKDSILSDTVEAVIGAAYLCHGLEPTRAFVHRLVDSLLEVAADLGAGLDWKTSLQEVVAERDLSGPEYAVEGEGPAHARSFTATVRIGGEVLGTGHGSAKKHAEQEAAAAAYRALTAPAGADDGATVPAGAGGGLTAPSSADGGRTAPSGTPD